MSDNGNYYNRWNHETMHKFVREYRKRECLWNSRCPEYSCRLAREAALQGIIKSMALPSFTVSDVKMKIRIVRNSYVNELKRIWSSRRSDPHFKYVCRKPWLRTADSFLKNLLRNKSGDVYLYECSLAQNRSNRRSWKPDQMRHALEAVSRGCKIRVAARNYKIPESSIRTRMKIGLDDLYEEEVVSQIDISWEHEQSIIRLAKSIYEKIGCVTMTDLRKITYEYATHRQIDNNFDHIRRLADKKWTHIFCKCYQDQLYFVEVRLIDSDITPGLEDVLRAEINGNADFNEPIYVSNNWQELSSAVRNNMEASFECANQVGQSQVETDVREVYASRSIAALSMERESENLREDSANESSNIILPGQLVKAELNCETEDMLRINEDYGSESSAGRTSPENEFDIFGKTVAHFLKNIPQEAALRAQANIFSMLTEERLKFNTHKCDCKKRVQLS